MCHVTYLLKPRLLYLLYLLTGNTVLALTVWQYKEKCLEKWILQEFQILPEDRQAVHARRRHVPQEM